MSSTHPEYDLVIVGGGPAGGAAALAARSHDLRTLVIDRGSAASAATCAGWMGPAATKLCRECGVDVDALGDEFSGVRLWPWDLSKNAEVKDAELAGRLVNPPKLSRALLTLARARGADVLTPAAVVQLAAGEDRATLRLADGRSVTGRVFILAAGAPSDLIRTAAFSPGSPDTRAPDSAVAVLSSKKAVGHSLEVILGATRAFKLVTIARAGKSARATLLTHDYATPAVEQLTAVLDTARKTGLLPADCTGRPLAAPGLAGLALEYESHVGKRALLVGTAGGFVAAFSNDGLYPALRSGWLAAETAARALQAPVLQDELAMFSSTWRTDLADYLRMPNTDLALLLPMVFSNPQMSRRVARAFLLGQGL